MTESLAISAMTKSMDHQKKMIFMMQFNASKKDQTTTLILGLLCLDRFFLGDVGLGLLKLLTMGGCGIWWLIDLFTCQSRAEKYNIAKAQEIALMIA